MDFEKFLISVIIIAGMVNMKNYKLLFKFRIQNNSLKLLLIEKNKKRSWIILLKIL